MATVVFVVVVVVVMLVYMIDLFHCQLMYVLA